MDLATIFGIAELTFMRGVATYLFR